MAASIDPLFAIVPRHGTALLGTRDTTALPTGLTTTPANVSTIITGVAAGTKITAVLFKACGVTAAGVINLFVYDSTTYSLYDQIYVDAITATNVLPAYRLLKTYVDLDLPTASWSLRATHTCAAATNDSILRVQAFGADYTA